MPSMLELIKQNAVPAAVMRSAAKGILSVSPLEMVQILVYLTRNPVFGAEAKTTLAQWHEPSAIEIVAASEAPQEVLDYFWSEENRRPRLVPALIENPRIAEQQLVQLASKASRETLAMLLASPRVQSSPAVLATLLDNAQLTPAELAQIQTKVDSARSSLASDEPVDPEAETAHHVWKQDHATEIAAEEGKAFELVDADADEAAIASAAAGRATAQAGIEKQVAPDALVGDNPAVPEEKLAIKTLEPEKVSTLQKLARMNVAGRIKSAFLGTKEERSILIRDGAKLVQNAVLASPKLSELEVEAFAAQKNVQENVLREIARSRRFMKNYIVVKNLVNNPRCPLDVSLTLIKNLLIMDLKALQTNKNVADTIRKVAMKMYKEKSTPPGHKPE
jgi:hypothetical protein